MVVVVGGGVCGGVIQEALLLTEKRVQIPVKVIMIGNKLIASKGGMGKEEGKVMWDLLKTCCGKGS